MLWWWMMMMMMMMMMMIHDSWFMIHDSGLRMVMILDKYHFFRTCYTPVKQSVSLLSPWYGGPEPASVSLFHSPLRKTVHQLSQIGSVPRDRDENEKLIFWNHHLDTIYIYIYICSYSLILTYTLRPISKKPAILEQPGKSQNQKSKPVICGWNSGAFAAIITSEKSSPLILLVVVVFFKCDFQHV